MVARSVKSRTDETETLSAAKVPDDQAMAMPDVSDMTPVTEPDLATLPEPDPLPAPEPVQKPEPEPDLPIDAPLNPLPPDGQMRQRSLGPLVLGGIVAAALGYAAAYFGQQGRSADLMTLLSAQTDRIAALETQLAALPAPADLSPLNAALSDVQAALGSGRAETAETLAGLQVRLDALEKAPNADGTLSETAIVAWEAELDALRSEIGAEQARMQGIADAAAAQLDQTRAEAATIEQTATESAVNANTRAALARVQAALDSGSPFEAALGDLSAGISVPESLAAVAIDGVPTMLTLQTTFPDAARAALAIARSEGLAGEDGGGIAAFLRNQFDVRSVTPQDGATADAILSRAEDALRQNRLSDAIAEVAALPEVVRAEMSGWTAAAETRIAAIAAVEGLSEILTQN